MPFSDVYLDAYQRLSQQNSNSEMDQIPPQWSLMHPSQFGYAGLDSSFFPRQSTPRPVEENVRSRCVADVQSNVGGSNELGSGVENLADSDEFEDSDCDLRTNDKRSGRRKIKIEFIEDRTKRNITFSKRRSGIMKKILLVVASETGHVYTFATPKLQPIVMDPEGKNMIQECLNSPDDDKVLLSVVGLGYPLGTNFNIAGMYGNEESYVGSGHGHGLSGDNHILTGSSSGMQSLRQFVPTSVHEYPWMIGIMQSGTQMSSDSGMDIGTMGSSLVYPQHSIQSRSFMGSSSQSM